MSPKNRVTKEEYLKLLNDEKTNLSSSRNSSIHQNNKDAIQMAYDTAVQEIRHIQALMPIMCYSGPVGIKVEYSESKADTDNILKGVSDALNQVFYEDDKQIKAAVCYSNDSDGQRLLEGTTNE